MRLRADTNPIIYTLKSTADTLSANLPSEPALMFFACGSISPHPGPANAETVTAMAASRRTARTCGATSLRRGAVAVASAGARVYSTGAGSSTVLMFRPGGESATLDAERLDAITHAWHARGELSLAGFDGPFLVCALDGEGGGAALANDRFGICPLYFIAVDGSLRFSTDIDALVGGLRSRPGISSQAIYDYVFFHCIPGPRTIYQGIEKLGPAESVRWRGGRPTRMPYWQPTFATDDSTIPASAELLAALESAVAERATEGCGAFLSGGLDSSSVAGMLARTQGRAATFTIGFDAEGYDESSFARIAADHFKTDHREYFVSPADVCESLPEIAAHYGEPFGNSSAIPTYYCARFARQHGVDFMLAGDGGDELFAGNTRYVSQDVFETWFRLPAFLRSWLKGGYRLVPLLAHLPIAGKGARYIEQAEMGLPDRLQSYNFLNRFDPATVFNRDWLAQVDTVAPWALWRERYAEPETPSALQRMLYLDWKFTLADNDLVKVNHMCDLAGVEVAYPMLDTDVADLSCRLSERALLHGGQLRGFYKDAVRAFLPDTIIGKSKHGFGLPFGVWMQRDPNLSRMAAANLENLAKRNIFSRDFLRRAQSLHASEAAGYYGELVWILSTLELWLEAHKR